MSGAAYDKPVPRDRPHWYITHIDYCPVCFSERKERTRMPGKRPSGYAKRYVIEEHYDWCNEGYA